MAKLCPRGKPAAKSKFKVYASCIRKHVCIRRSVLVKSHQVAKTKTFIKKKKQWWFIWIAGLGGEKKKSSLCVVIIQKDGLRKWVSEKWVDIGEKPKKDGKQVSTLRSSEGLAKGSIQNAYHLQKPHG